MQKKINVLSVFPKLSKANTLIVHGETFYIKKQNSVYYAWHYPDGLLVTLAVTKEKLEKLIGDRWKSQEQLLHQYRQ